MRDRGGREREMHTLMRFFPLSSGAQSPAHTTPLPCTNTSQTLQPVYSAVVRGALTQAVNLANKEKKD